MPCQNSSAPVPSAWYPLPTMGAVPREAQALAAAAPKLNGWARRQRWHPAAGRQQFCKPHHDSIQQWPARLAKKPSFAVFFAPGQGHAEADAFEILVPVDATIGKHRYQGAERAVGHQDRPPPGKHGGLMIDMPTGHRRAAQARLCRRLMGLTPACGGARKNRIRNGQHAWTAISGAGVPEPRQAGECDTRSRSPQ